MSALRRRAVCTFITAGLALGVTLVGVPPAAAAPLGLSSVPVASWRTNGTGDAALVVGGVAYVGGTFSSVTSPSGGSSSGRANLAAFRVDTGALITTFRADTDGTVRSLASDGFTLFLGGSFNSVNGVARRRVAAVDLGTGAVRPGWSADTNANVYDLSIAGTRLYLVGSFSTVRGMARTRAAAVSLADGSLTPFAPAANATLQAVSAAPDGSAVYLGGSQTTVNGVSSASLTRVTATGTVVPRTWESLVGPVLALEVSADGSRLASGVAGGNQGAWYNTTNGQRLFRQRCDGDAQAVHVIDGNLLTGFHESCDGDTTVRLTSNDTTTGTRDTEFHPSFDRFWGVFDIAGDRSGLVVAGDMTLVSGVLVGGFAIFGGGGGGTGSVTTETWSGADGSAWPSQWATSSSAGTVDVQGQSGRLAVSGPPSFARAQLSGTAATADSDLLVSFRWDATSVKSYLEVFVRGSGGWASAYRPRNGYGLALTSTSPTVGVERTVNGTVTTLGSVTGQAVTTSRQWLRLHVEGNQLMFRTWLDGSAEPSGWAWNGTDSGLAGSTGQVHVSHVMSSSSTGSQAVRLDDLTLTSH